MRKFLFAIFALFSVCAVAQVSVQPILQPHVTFVNSTGTACAGCSLYTYAAGTTTPLATYTDSTGTSQNTNPIILDASGSATVWMALQAYKFVLKDTLGTTLWTVDNVTEATGIVEGAAQYCFYGQTLTGTQAVANCIPGLSWTSGTITATGAITGNSLTATQGVAGATVNATTGFQVAGAAASNHVLLGNGTDYVDSATVPYSILSGVPSFYYQTLAANGTAQTQRPTANFSPYFSLSDSSSPAETTVAPVVAGTDTKLLTASAGSPSTGYYACADSTGGVTFQAAGCGTASSYALKFWPNQSLCTPTTSTDANCTGTFTFPSSFAFADTSYGLNITAESTSGAFVFATVTAKTTTTASYTITCTFNCGSYGTLTFDILGWHP